MNDETLKQENAAGWSVALSILLLCFTAYLVTADLQPRSIDEVASYVVTRSIVGQRSVSGDALTWLHDQMGHGAVTAPGLDGHQYVIKDIGPSLLAVPLAWLGRWLGMGPVPLVMLLMPLLTAISAALLYRFSARRWGRLPALLAALGFGLGSLAWPYAETFFTQPAAALGLLLALIGSIEARERGSWRWALLGGTGLGLAGLSALPAIITGPLYLLYLSPWDDWRQEGIGPAFKRGWPLLAAFGGSVAICVLIQAGYNMLRFGSPLETGHAINNALTGRTAALFSLRYLPAGLFGQLLSTPKGLLWYAPFSVMALPGFIRAVSGRERQEGLLIGGQAALITLFYSLYVFWNGGVAWGPRHLTDIMPALALLTAFALADLFGEGQEDTPRWKKALVLGLLALSVATQASASIAYDHRLEAERYAVTDPTVAPEVTLASLLSVNLAPQATWLRGFLAPVWTVLWASEGQVDGWGLTWRIGLLAINGAALWLVWRQKRQRAALSAQLMGTLLLPVVMIGQLAQAGTDDPFSDLIRTAEISVVREDLVLTVLPDTYLPWLLGYTGPARDIGLASDSPAPKTTGPVPESAGDDGPVVWLVTDVPPGSSSVESWLAERAYRGTESWFDAHYRLTPFHLAEDPSNIRQIGTAFGNGLQLIQAGYRVTLRGLDVYCRWLVQEGGAEGVNTFLHLIGPDGTLVAQIDGPLPVASGGAAEQRQYILLPDALPAGAYSLYVGLYHWQTGERIPLADGSGDRVLLGMVTLPAK